MDVDAFVMFTDNEVNTGRHAAQCMVEYRNKQNKPDAAFAVFGMTATPYSIADPADRRTMNFVGFDSSAPAALADFITGVI